MQFDPDKVQERILENGRKVLWYPDDKDEHEVEYAPTVPRETALRFLKRVIERSGN